MPIPKMKPQQPTTVGFYVSREHDGFSWRAIHRNGRVLAESGKAYNSKHELNLTLENFISALKQGDVGVFDQTE